MVAVKTDAQVSHLADNGLPVTSADVRRLMAEKKALREALIAAVEYMEFKATENCQPVPLERARAALHSEQGENDE